MPTQQEIAVHLGLNQSEVSRHMKSLEIDWRVAPMDEIRLAYIEHLRAMAAGHRSADGDDLTKERVLTERVDRELKLLQLAEKKGQLIHVEQLRPDLANAFHHIKTTLLTCADKLKPQVDARYGIDFDVALINAEHEHALIELARHAGCK